MIRVPIRGVTAVVFAATLLTGCGDDPDGDAGQPAPVVEQTASQTASVVGLLVSADTNQVVITLADGSARSFGVRPEDAPRLGIRHLASHAGLTDIGFRITYVTVDGMDYVVGAEETAPPA
jgi:hypothetical protein